MVKNEISSNVNKWEREMPPSHYIDSFSKLATMLSKGGRQYFKSKTFDASGYKWNFLIYPDGDEKTDSKGHISVSVCIEDTATLPKIWAKYAELKFFIYDQARKKYSIFQVGGSSNLHDFHSLKTEWGITKLVSRAAFDDPANGYLVNDKCVFGVEVFLLDSQFSEESLSMCVEGYKTFTWTVSDCSNLGDEVHYSYEFPVSSFKWRIQLSGGEHLSLCLELVDEKISCGKHQEGEACGFITPKLNWGWTKFARLTDFQDLSKGSVDSNCIEIEARIMNIYTINS
ncbi:uncharacterized protein LOC116023665 [Ipomoea triloba]|uniref:uncharacterized protein LOC116023665 n=1 Tax=Ipomoea triloba TaxID=35885 RepID=UPI00125DBE53|nr:uncharacterized protein LOC116023665 [Ipomoea triloba]